jgi:hypothetical protein
MVHIRWEHESSDSQFVISEFSTLIITSDHSFGSTSLSKFMQLHDAACSSSAREGRLLSSILLE